MHNSGALNLNPFVNSGGLNLGVKPLKKESYAPIQFGGDGVDGIIFTLNDTSGNIYIIGRSTSASIYGISNPLGSGKNGSFIAKFNSNLKFKGFKWLEDAGSPSTDILQTCSAIIDGSNIIIASTIRDTSPAWQYIRLDKYDFSLNRIVRNTLGLRDFSNIYYYTNIILSKRGSNYVCIVFLNRITDGTKGVVGCKIADTFTATSSPDWSSMALGTADAHYSYSGIYALQGEDISGTDELRVFCQNLKGYQHKEIRYNYTANTITSTLHTYGEGVYRMANNVQAFCNDNGDTSKVIQVCSDVASASQYNVYLFRGTKYNAADAATGKTLLVTDVIANATRIYGIVPTNTQNVYVIFGNSATVPFALQAGTISAFVCKATWNGSGFTFGTPKKLGVAGSISDILSMTMPPNNLTQIDGIAQYYTSNKMFLAYHSQGNVYATSAGSYDCVCEIINVDTDL